MLYASSLRKTSSMNRSLILHNMSRIVMKYMLTVVERHNKRYKDMIGIDNRYNLSLTLIPKKQHLIPSTPRDRTPYYTKTQFPKFEIRQSSLSCSPSFRVIQTFSYDSTMVKALSSVQRIL